MYDRVVNQLLSAESSQFARIQLAVSIEFDFGKGLGRGEDLLVRPASVAKSANPIVNDFICDRMWYSR
jgi:hypothetical protein